MFLLLKIFVGMALAEPTALGSDWNPSQSRTSDNPCLRFCVCPNVVSAPCSSGTLNHHSVMRTLRTTGWGLNAKTVDGIANENLR